MSKHVSVLLDGAVDQWFNGEDGIYIDGTFGRGGHSRLLLSRLSSKARLIVFDQDPEAIEFAQALAQEDSRVTVVQKNFSYMEEVLNEMGLMGKINGILLDIGVSSPQLDDAERGFSFMREGPLDMRMNTLEGETAAEWINSATDREIAQVLWQYGEEKQSRRIARAVVAQRLEKPLETTLDLANLVAGEIRSHQLHKHPATRTFQAIRIFINKELDVLHAVLPQACQALAVKGHLTVICFHSLEDRIVKRYFRHHARGDDLPRDLPVTQDMIKPRLNLISKAMKASKEELDDNPRARSAVMRSVERTEAEWKD